MTEPDEKTYRPCPAALDPRIPAVVVADHGLYAWGADPLQARHHTEIVQWLLEVTINLP